MGTYSRCPSCSFSGHHSTLLHVIAISVAVLLIVSFQKLVRSTPQNGGYNGKHQQQVHPFTDRAHFRHEPVLILANKVSTLQAVEPYLDESLHVPLADVLELIQAPGRVKRPKRIAIIMRGMPGSGKSYVARKLRDAEVAAGGEAPRVHSIDDYFITVSCSSGMRCKALGRLLTFVQQSGAAHLPGLMTCPQALVVCDKDLPSEGAM